MPRPAPPALSLGLVSLSLVLGGCSLMRPTLSPIPVALTDDGATAPSSEAWFAGGGGECLLVLLPGIGDSAQDFVRSGFLGELGAEHGGCDVAVVDAHFSYYLAQSVVERLTDDVLVEAARRGYRSVWIVGVSLGGYGALLATRARPELVDGLVLIAPMLGVPPREPAVVDEIARAGGLHRWRGPEIRTPYRHHFGAPHRVWSFLRDATRSPSWDGRLVLAFGQSDRLADRYSMLADVLPPEAVFEARGAHDWATWRRLWRQVLHEPPWAARSDRRR